MSLIDQENIILVDLPTFPKAIISLSLPVVAAYLNDVFAVKIIDLNLPGGRSELFSHPLGGLKMVGLKVSAQNFHLAVQLTAELRQKFPGVKMVWGGEYPTLEPDKCLTYADTILTGLFEPVAVQFCQDFANERLSRIYPGSNEFSLDKNLAPAWECLPKKNAYYRFMGMPLETSRGCTETCTFCMVHVMQKKHYHLKPVAQISHELEMAGEGFVNVVDYNIGVDKAHVISTAQLIKQSKAVGWMGEMCLEALDDDEVLSALRESRCKMIYCGLETIEEAGLESVHKMNTNHIENYRRIIAKAQGYGIQVASGFILGLPGSTVQTFENALAFFESTGIMYVKLTFLTYNPGTKVQKYMQKKGTFVNDNPAWYDGNHLSYIPLGLDKNIVTEGSIKFIRKFYGLKGIIRRSRHIRGGLLKKTGFICFNLGYRHAYFQWLNYDILHQPERFEFLLQKPFRKNLVTIIAERLLLLIWRLEKNEQ
jgi:hypothetical protein